MSTMCSVVSSRACSPASRRSRTVLSTAGVWFRKLRLPPEKPAAPHPPGTNRVALLGDANGWLFPLQAALAGLGIDLSSGSWPDGLVVVHTGGLGTEGPDARAVLRLLDRLMSDHPSQSVQLIGPMPHYEDRACRREAAAGLTRSWIERRRFAACTVNCADEQWLVTASGLDRAAWRSLGRPPDAATAADRLQARLLEGSPLVAADGALYASWRGRRAPFSQIVGSSPAADFKRLEWSSAVPYVVRPRSQRRWTSDDFASRRLPVHVGGRTITSVTCGFTATRPRWPMFPLILEATVSVPGSSRGGCS